MAALIEFQLPILVLPSLRPLRVSNVTNCFPLPAAKVPLSAWGRVVPTSDMTTAHDLVLYMEHQPKIHSEKLIALVGVSMVLIFFERVGHEGRRPSPSRHQRIEFASP